VVFETENIMSKQITLHNKEDIEKKIEELRLSAEKSQLYLDKICGYSDPLELLKKFKFEKIGHDPLNIQRPLNFIEQLNQTFTYLASFKAASILFEMHPGLTSMTLNLGTRAGSDIESDFDGGIAAEVFAAVNPKSNNKLKKDIQKVSSVNVKHKYVFLCVQTSKKDIIRM
jgi:hypothetical protein